MQAFYNDHLGFNADLCQMLYRETTRLTVYDPEGHCIHRKYYATWEIAKTTLRHIMPDAVNEITHHHI